MSAVNIDSIIVTGPEKTGLIYAKYTHSYYSVYLFLCSCYLISVSFIKFLRIFSTHDEICVMILCCYVEIFHFKDLNVGPNLLVDKTCFLRPGHNYHDIPVYHLSVRNRFNTDIASNLFWVKTGSYVYSYLVLTKYI